MEPLHLAHLILISLWAGVIAAEVVVELTLREGEAARLGAIVHYWIDLLFEGPLLLGILVTGALLLRRAWPPTTLHVVKVAAAGIALSVNGWCVAMVILRRRHADDSIALQHYRRRVLWAGVGAPFGLVAAYLGFAYFL